ncbi:hypothetical protein [Streptomyces sp. NPDC058861]|uniref:hypothetical protein n=1 Tax=Streptomyces sp. NPDC058861 TaxID=3346653 RepID=UPI00368F9598
MPMQEIRIVDATCDACAETDKREPAVDVIRVGHTVYWLCQPHFGKFAAYFRDLFKKVHQEQAPDPRPACVITGNIPGYSSTEARDAAEGLGYRIAGHADADTALIICGTRPAPHKVREAAEHSTPCFDATSPRAFARAISAGAFTATDALPTVAHKLTAADVAKKTT